MKQNYWNTLTRRELNLNVDETDPRLVGVCTEGLTLFPLTTKDTPQYLLRGCEHA